VTTLTMRPYAGEVDLQPIADMLNECEALDTLDEGTSVGDLRLEFADPEVDPARDLRLWEDAGGRLIGFGQLSLHAESDEPDGYLWFKVHPSARGEDLEAQILAWGAERIREVERERGMRIELVASARALDHARQELLAQHGFSVLRYFLRLARPLDEPIPEPQFPAGFTLMAGDHDPAAWAAMHNESFIDHWRYHPWTVEGYNHAVSDPDYRPALNLIATAPDGTFAGFCWCEIHEEENARTGHNEGWIHLLGTRRGFRRIGLGRAMLLAGLHCLKAAGVEQAKLGVDADSPTGATRLYASVGFEEVFRTIVYRKPLV
jgi:mycothiol synthase